MNEPAQPKLADLAATYATRRKAEAIANKELEAVLTSEALAVAAATEALKAAHEAMSLAAAKKTEYAVAKQATADAEAAKKAVLEAWKADPKQDKTHDSIDGRVQIKVGEGVDVVDAELLAKDLLAKNLFKAGVKKLTVDEKFLRTLHDAAPLPGVSAVDSLTVAYTAPKPTAAPQAA